MTGQAIALPCKIEAIMNVYDLFAALAVGWGDETRRIVVSGFRGDKTQFVQHPDNRLKYPIWQMRDGDIPIDSGPIGMMGFIKFESNYMFGEMFKTYVADDGAVATAYLTQRGFDFANTGVMDFHIDRELKLYAFYVPKTMDANIKTIGIKPLEIGKTK